METAGNATTKTKRLMARIWRPLIFALLLPPISEVIPLTAFVYESPGFDDWIVTSWPLTSMAAHLVFLMSPVAPVDGIGGVTIFLTHYSLAIVWTLTNLVLILALLSTFKALAKLFRPRSTPSA